MDALDRFVYHKKRFRRKLGGTKLSAEAARHLSRAAEIEQILEMCEHAMMLGVKFDPAEISALRAQLPLALMQLTLAAGPARNPHFGGGQNLEAR